MRIYSESEKARMRQRAAIVAEYNSLVEDGTRPLVAKEYLAKKFGCSVAKIYYTLKHSA